jgi:hypothetical protein
MKAEELKAEELAVFQKGLLAKYRDYTQPSQPLESGAIQSKRRRAIVGYG